MDAYFFTAFVFFVSMNDRSLHRHFQYRCGCSNYCLFFWKNLHLQNRAGHESRWTCSLKGPNVTSWSSKVRNSGTSCSARHGLQHMLCLVGCWKVWVHARSTLLWLSALSGQVLYADAEGTVRVVRAEA